MDGEDLEDLVVACADGETSIPSQLHGAKASETPQALAGLHIPYFHGAKAGSGQGKTPIFAGAGALYGPSSTVGL